MAPTTRRAARRNRPADAGRGLDARRRGLAAGASGVVIALTLAACSTAGTSAGSAGSPDHNAHGAATTSSVPAAPSTSPHADDAARAGDVTFAQQMIPHHEQAVEMADLALKKPSASATVRRLATQIKAAQDPEITTMRGWLSAWGAPATPSADHGAGHGGHGEGMMSAQDMADLAKAEGAAFDRSWVTMMITHHEGAVTMSQQVLRTTQNPHVKALAEEIIAAQQKEIATMRGLLETTPTG